jgi:hypothetical protein
MGLRPLFGKRSFDDRLLSGELSPDTGKGRARAQQLTSRRNRERVAEELRDLVDEAQKPHAAFLDASLRVNRGAVRDSQARILILAEDLERLDTVNPLGVILADRLVRDGDSPAYLLEDEGQLSAAAVQAREALKAD